jgi:hypothetical protein
MTGYTDGVLGRRIHVNDPWRGPTTISLRHVPLLMYAFPPPQATGRNDEYEVAADSDGDGVVDFDEILRFGTDHNRSDSDSDWVPDKEEIELSVFDPKHGFSYVGDARDQIDGDAYAPERDRDSDDGGCADGLEDLDRDGNIEPSSHETSPYERKDDGCVSGFSRLFFDVTTPHGNGSTHGIHDLHGEFSLTPNDAGELVGSGVFYYRFEGEDRHPGVSCDIGYWPATGAVWSSPLTGRNEDGFIIVDKSLPSPPYDVSYTECGLTSTEVSTIEWMGASGAPIDGVYDQTINYDVAPGTGEHWLQVHIEQATPAPPLRSD